MRLLRDFGREDPAARSQNVSVVGEDAAALTKHLGKLLVSEDIDEARPARERIPKTKKEKNVKSRLLTSAARFGLCLSVVAAGMSTLPNGRVSANGDTLPNGRVSVVAAAGDWPQWRGPERNGVSRETGLLKQWPKEGPKLLWQVNDIGDGYSGPAVVGNRLYLMSNIGMENEFVQALSTKDGKAIWTTRVGNVGNPEQNPKYPKARSTPTVDGNFIYALGSDGDLVCLETKSGKIRWQKSLRKDFGGQPHEWAYAESPLVDGDVVVVTPGGAQATMVALNKKTGATVWKSAIPGGDPAGYASAVVVQGGGRKQYVQFLSKGLVGVDAKTGQFLWRYTEVVKGPAQVFTPVVRAGHVYAGALSIGGGLVRLKAEGNGVVAEQVYFARGLPNGFGLAVLVGDYMYGTEPADQQTVAVEFTTGKVIWKAPGLGRASITYADGLLFVHAWKGDVGLVEATPEGYREKGRFTPPNPPKPQAGAPYSDTGYSHPVIANGVLYVRDAGTLWAWDVKAGR